MRAGCRRHTCSVKGFRGLGVERMVKRDIVTSVSCCVVRVRVKDMPSGGKIDATHAPERGIRELDSMRVEYSEPLAAWIFPRQGTHGLYAVHGVDGCARTRFCLFLENVYRARWKKQSHGNKRTANSTGRLHNDHHRAACTPHSTLHSSQESRSLHLFHRLPWDAVYVVSKAQVKKCIVVT